MTTRSSVWPLWLTRTATDDAGLLLINLCTMERLGEDEFQALLAFRTAMRRFNHWSEEQAKAVGLTHAQHQLLLAVKGHNGPLAPTIGDLAHYLMLRHHSTVELVNRAQAGGYVERARDPHDGRVVRLSLTEKGEDCLRRLTHLHIVELRQLAPLLEQVVDRTPTDSALPQTDDEAPKAAVPGNVGLGLASH